MPSNAIQSPRRFLQSLFDAALDAARPALCLPPHLPPPPGDGRTVVIGAGKAAAAMAQAVEQHWQEPLGGLVVTRDGHGADCQVIEVIEAAHPVPDARGREAARRILESVQGLSEDDLVLCLISGGGSALLTMPGEGLALEDKQTINRALLKCGAPIDEMNTVRKHLSAIKGGRLAAAAYPARVLTLAISDVPGDDPAIIASGPTVADPSSTGDARAILKRYDIDIPPGVETFLASPAAETPDADDPRLSNAHFEMIATPRMALDAAEAACRAAGVRPVVLGDDIEGEARDVGREMAAMALEQVGQGPVALLSGGETTVTVRGKGRGGRNAEFLLALTVALDGAPGVHALACDTDGIDGSEDNAGAHSGPETLARARALGLDAQAMLDNNDGYGFFDALGDLIVTGPTRTNVNDFRAILIE